jgi:hypothetical protein
MSICKKEWKNAIPKFFACKVNVKINDKILAGFGCNSASVKYSKKLKNYASIQNDYFLTHLQ